MIHQVKVITYVAVEAENKEKAVEAVRVYNGQKVKLDIAKVISAEPMKTLKEIIG